MSKEREQRKVQHTTDSSGNPIVLVPIRNHPKPAVLNRDDFERLREAGYSDQWRYEVTKPGYGYVRTKDPKISGSNITVARLVIEAGAGKVVKHRDGNRLNLRRENLRLDGGKAKRAASTNVLVMSSDF